ncbi:hypothetical protein WN73_06975 [Bradyrhizobium sp. CCBAU 45394]|uniref:hypothetical protein n=1 Tax=Bradyrhizobium sp. CCBAU 45394 TaxID=1325087 RepID=UPI00230215BC|nr:hypothetical protein [Bradyrhizobium sp. CCBAU 45394]MDA9390443.1 hypothetical protein [Bradyrhizobium sp. CCBAU 45394]
MKKKILNLTLQKFIYICKDCSALGRLSGSIGSCRHPAAPEASLEMLVAGVAVLFGHVSSSQLVSDLVEGTREDT